jgi:AraC family transcriptional regulator of adaptative response / DNA-3-methyladenine glycosylase II
MRGWIAVAARLGITDRHLRRAFGAEFGVSPVEFAQTQRLLLAKRLLTDTALPVTEVAFRERLRQPAALQRLVQAALSAAASRQLRRHMKDSGSSVADALQFELSFRPPYDWPRVSAFLAARADRGRRSVEGGIYRRTVRMRVDGKTQLGWIEVSPSPKKAALRVALSASLAKALPPVLSRVKALMDLACNPAEVARRSGRSPRRIPACACPAPSMASRWRCARSSASRSPWRAARTVAGRFAAASAIRRDAVCRADDRFSRGGNHRPIALRAHRRLGMPGARARTVLALARAVAERRPGPDAECRHRSDARQAARAARRRRMDRAVHRHARARLARRFSAHRLGVMKGARRETIRAVLPRRSLAALARLCGHASLESLTKD